MGWLLGFAGGFSFNLFGCWVVLSEVRREAWQAGGLGFLRRFTIYV